jgi:hypothetical protein
MQFAAHMLILKSIILPYVSTLNKKIYLFTYYNPKKQILIHAPNQKMPLKILFLGKLKTKYPDKI